MLKVKNINFSYGDHFKFENISFEINKGEHQALIGESGCGKSTLLKLLYGEYDLTSGEITWDNKIILGPKHNLVVGYSFMKYVTQEFDLMPFTSVAQNIGTYLSNFYPEEKAERTAELLKVVELEDFKDTKVRYLSGGQKQRVAIAKALAKKPEIILLDEPFSHIDNFKKHSLRRNLFEFLKKENIACVISTHDKDDILAYSDKVIALNEGKFTRKGTPKELYEDPRDLKIAAFFSEFNLIPQQFLKGCNTKFGICYPTDIIISSKNIIEVEIIQSYYNGLNYLNTANLKEHIIKFYSEELLKPKSIVNIEIRRFSKFHN